MGLLRFMESLRRRNKKESVDDALTMFIKAQVESYPHSYFLRKGPRNIEFRRR